MSDFSELTRSFLEEEYAASPVMASSLGVDGYDDRLDDVSEAAFERRRRRSDEWLETFQGVPSGDLSFADQVDRDLIVATLRGRQIMADWEMWRRNPDAYLNPGLEGVFTLILHRLKPEAEIARAASARLRQVPENVEAGMRNLKAELAPRVYVERALDQAEAGAAYARDLLPAEIEDPKLRSDVAAAGAVAAGAFDDFAKFLRELKERAHGEWAIGEQRYTSLLRERELLDLDTRTLRERGRQEYDRLAENLRQCAQTVAATDDWPAVLRSLNAEHPRSPDAMREGYAEWTERARQFLRERRLVSFPEGEECSVEPSPPFQRPILAVASYESPPPFSRSMRGHFFVPYPPAGADDEEIQKRLETNSYPSIPTTSVHEAYPGHHWHMSTAKGNPSAVRQVLGTPYFWEGWALYAERMMREQGFFTDPKAEMAQYEATIFRAARIIVDTSLHMGEMPFDEAVTFMREKANLSEPTAVAEVGRYCSWPTQASAYLTGCLEILRIRERFLAEKGLSGAEGLRRFHDRLASSGSLPIALAERVVMQDGVA